MKKSLFVTSGNVSLELEYIAGPEPEVLSIKFRKGAGGKSCDDPGIKKLAAKLSDFLEGKDPHFDMDDFALLDTAKLTAFTRKVLLTLFTKVPRGTVVSYKELAELSGYPKAVRAVGSVMAKNPFPLIIPCHRVIKSDSSLGNYGPGKKLKEHFLKLEKDKTD